jgi:hypothetical protein
MRNTRDMTAEEIATELVRLAHHRPSSGNLNKLNFALDQFKGKGSQRLDSHLAEFDENTGEYIRRVQRGYAGTVQWCNLRELAEKIAPALEILGAVLEKENAQ